MKNSGLNEFQNYKQVTVLPGDFYVTDKKNEVITTVLGSCISACVRDTVTGIGGLNHFLLPRDKSEKGTSLDGAMRYGDYAMNTLIGKLIRMGVARERMEVKIFGGANLFKVSSQKTVGDSNQAFILDFLKNEGLDLAVSNIGGNHGRRIYYHPATGKVKMQFLNNAHVDDIIKQETKLSKTVDTTYDKGGDIELFG